MKCARRLFAQAMVVVVVLFGANCGLSDVEAPGDLSVYGSWQNGPPQDPEWFPIGVWLQDPSRAEQYRDLGINLYLGLWQGPTERQLDQLRRAGMKVICRQNEVALQHLGDRTIIAWMHDDEPDNAQPLPEGGYGPPVSPAKIEEAYHAMRLRDNTRPVFLNLGQGVAWDGWYGRGERTGHPEDYPEYVKGADIVSFDIYPAVHDHEDVAGRLEFVATGVKRLVGWAGEERVVWNIIEASRIHNASLRPTAAQIRSEVWMSLVSGSRGIVYFVHQFEPTFLEASLLEDPELREAVRLVNRQIQSLASVLNSPDVPNLVQASAVLPDVPVDVLVKRHEGDVYVFAVTLRDTATEVHFDVAEGRTFSRVSRLDGEGELALTDGRFSDILAGYGVGLYRLSD